MNAWSNIEASPDDQEIALIDRREHALGSLAGSIADVRMMITRFELCHFKYQTHYRHIIQSIAALKPTIDIDGIGKAHPRNGEQAIQHDATGRSLTGQRYINALRLWLGQPSALPDISQREVNQRVSLWLGERNHRKEKLAAMLIDRLLYKLDGYEYQTMTGLDIQVMKTDICCYAFPDNLETMIRAIGQLTPIEVFHGCGTTNPEIRRTAGRWLKGLCRWLQEGRADAAVTPGGMSPERVWLAACLAKTIKEQIHASAWIHLPPL